MSAATPASVPAHPVAFFESTRTPGSGRSVAQQRSRALSQVRTATGDLAAAVASLGADFREADLDLNLERYWRAADRVVTALRGFDEALADPAGPPPPTPHRRRP